jgi:hypothetical protein
VADARRLGFDPLVLRFGRTISTANGPMLSGHKTDIRESDVKIRWKTKAEWMADHAAIFDASPFKHDKKRRDAFLKRAEKVFDQELENAWGGQFTISGRSSTDDGSAR